MNEKPENQIGLIHNQDYFQQLCLSIIDDLDNNNFSWFGDEHGIHLTINGQSKFIPNEADEEKEIEQLWNQAKNKPQQSVSTHSTSGLKSSKKL